LTTTSRSVPASKVTQAPLPPSPAAPRSPGLHRPGGTRTRVAGGERRLVRDGGHRCWRMSLWGDPDTGTYSGTTQVRQGAFPTAGVPDAHGRPPGASGPGTAVRLSERSFRRLRPLRARRASMSASGLFSGVRVGGSSADTPLRIPPRSPMASPHISGTQASARVMSWKNAEGTLSHDVVRQQVSSSTRQMNRDSAAGGACAPFALNRRRPEGQVAAPGTGGPAGTVAPTGGPAPHGRGTRRPHGRPLHEDPGPRSAVSPPRAGTKTYFYWRTVS
jgi:hypothetical protein